MPCWFGDVALSVLSTKGEVEAKSGRAWRARKPEGWGRALEDTGASGASRRRDAGRGDQGGVTERQGGPDHKSQESGSKSRDTLDNCVVGRWMDDGRWMDGWLVDGWWMDEWMVDRRIDGHC